jgi:hypothetical protein
MPLSQESVPYFPGNFIIIFAASHFGRLLLPMQKVKDGRGSRVSYLTACPSSPQNENCPFATSISPFLITCLLIHCLYLFPCFSDNESAQRLAA